MTKDRKTVAVLGTLDTKGEEVLYLKRVVESLGKKALVIDMGILGDPPFTPDIGRDEVAKKGGSSIETLTRLGDEGKAAQVMAEGVKNIVKELFEKGLIDGVLAIGGGQGSSMSSKALQALPLGFPKILVSTKAAQAGISSYVGTRDVMVMPSVADIVGLNRLTRKVLRNAAKAICGMLEELEEKEPEKRGTIVMTMLGTTTTCGLSLKRLLEGEGFEVVVFHAIGIGGRAMEEFIREEGADLVVELAINEVGNELFGGLASAGPERLEVAGSLGIPQIVTPGNADFINFLSPDTVPERYRKRKLHIHNPQATTMRLNAQEMEILGRKIAEKLNRSKGKVTVVVPLKGFSSWDRKGGIFYDPEADRAFLKALEEGLKKEIELKKVDLHINDPAFSGLLFKEVLKALKEKEGEVGR